MKILVAEDEVLNRRVLETFLGKWGYDTIIAKDGTEAWQILQQEEAPRLAILDWMMPGLDGVQICRELRKKNNPYYTYIILLTARFQREDIIAGLEAGADDYVTKPFDANELHARMRVGMRIIELHEQLACAQDRLQYQASHDFLTGVWSRSMILQTLEMELARAKRAGSSVGLIMADLDHFKRTNDLHGHLIGDAVLKEAALRMRNFARAYDAVGRYGGEEFLIVAPGSNLSGTYELAERLRTAVGGKPIDTPSGPISVTLSLGIAAGGTDEGAEANTLIGDADEALYRAKNGGRNRVEPAVQDSDGPSTPTKALCLDSSGHQRALK
jgi:diguanylate cyclase (GGDEF)-like protein